jgi:colanic acid/amylovoran biosynthesis glycosyltransferase
MSTQRMKIAFLVGNFPAISETFILNQITGLIDAGHQVDIFAKGPPAVSMAHAEVEHYRLMERTRYFKAPASRPERLWGALRRMAKMFGDRKPEIARAVNVRAHGRQAASLRLLYMLYPLLESGPYDILQCHFGPLGLAGLQLKEMGVPGKLAVAFHGNDISEFVKSNGTDVYHRLFRRADLLMPVSRYWKQRLIQLGADPGHIHVHRMGIDLSHFPYRPRSLAPSGEIRLMTVGRLVEKKGIPVALQAVARLLARRPDLNLCYHIIGSGEQEETLRRMIVAFGLQERAYLLGAQTREEIHRRLMEAHIFLLPSITDSDGDQEGIPVSLMEAMASGMPILSTLHTGIPELVEDGVSGYLAPEGDVDEMSDRLERLIARPEQWPEMGQNGRRFVETHHDIHTLNRQLVDLYQRLLDGPEGSIRHETAPPRQARPATYEEAE